MKSRYLKFSILALFIVALASCSKDSFDGSPDMSTDGKGGSMARFTIIGDYLYVIDDRELKVFDIETPDDPQFVKTVDVGFGIETIFPYGRHLFIGANTGMFIYNIDDPTSPVFVSEFEHVMACDPVVVQDSIAYVTLRAGSACRMNWWGVNSLDIIDVHQVSNPDLMVTHTLSNAPYGLGVDGNTLFLCLAEGGLGIYEISNPYNLSLIKAEGGIHAWDVIPNNGILLVIGKTGFYQYDYSNLQNITLLSSILIGS
jgi:hypothetical protein